MSTKITRGPAAFAKRVMIGSRRAWFITEGKRHDVRFYDKVMRTSGAFIEGDFTFRPGEAVRTPGGANAGGKARLLALHDYYKRNNELLQQTRDGYKAVFFLLDKDFDQLTGKMRRSAHILYTEYGDVEAEIFARGNLRSALADALGLTEEEAVAVAAAVGDPLRELTEAWREWIRLGAITAALGLRIQLKTRGPSQVNAQVYGPVVPGEVKRCESLISSNAGYSTSKHSWVASRVASRHRKGQLHYDFKGKHLPHYVKSRAEAHFRDVRNVDFAGFEHSITKLMLATIEFDRSWTDRWVARVESVLSADSAVTSPGPLV